MTIALERVVRSGRAGSSPVAWTAWALAGAAAAGSIAALRAGTTGTWMEPVCLLRQVAHVSCPICGLTRSLTLLARGDVAGSFSLHPWGAALTLQIVGGWAIWGLWNAGWLRLRPDRWLPHALAVNSLALAALWLVRWFTGTLP